MDLKSFSENIKSTGFILENMISSTLSNNKWNVINNKYYIDDVAKTAREIDIIAYKAAKIEDVFVYTTLIISCKKNEEKIWALLSKELNKNDPNLDLEPQHNWSNHPLINYQLSKNNIDKKIFLPENYIQDCSNHIYRFLPFKKCLRKMEDLTTIKIFSTQLVH
ncbi:hypothetical protein [Pectobacterium punjabense]|uniref:hypothetical protein n=1 Tax=Pectobacterium punjabense TaxID=2108399 RepID=UPI00380F790B